MHSSKRQSGRISFVLVAAIVTAALVVVLFAFNTQSPTTAASDFMSALARQDVDTLTKLSTLGEKKPEEIREAWTKTMSLSKHYLFAWHIVGTQNFGDSAAIRLQVVRNATRPSPYEENFALVLNRVNNSWKVDVPQIPREMFPNLPR